MINLHRRDFHLFALVERCDARQDRWRASIPDLATGMYGRTPSEAVIAVMDAARVLVAHDMSEGRDPLYARMTHAETEDRGRMEDIMLSTAAETISVASMDIMANRVTAFVIQLPTLRAEIRTECEDFPAQERISAWSDSGAGAAA